MHGYFSSTPFSNVHESMVHISSERGILLAAEQKYRAFFFDQLTLIFIVIIIPLVKLILAVKINIFVSLINVICNKGRNERVHFS